jgi:hypothetical protein
MVSKYEHRYKDEDPRRQARVLGSILAAAALPLMAVAVSAMTPPKPHVEATREAIAKHVIDRAKRGERDVNRLRDDAVAFVPDALQSK